MVNLEYCNYKADLSGLQIVYMLEIKRKQVLLLNINNLGQNRFPLYGGTTGFSPYHTYKTADEKSLKRHLGF